MGYIGIIFPKGNVMKEKKQEISLFLKILLQVAKAFHFPEMPDSPKIGKWYRVTPRNSICANGKPYHGCIRAGSERKLFIILNGGGVAVDPYTAARPISITSMSSENFYFQDVEPFSDAVAFLSLRRKDKEKNPFRNWSVVNIPYASGDFHAGMGDYPYKTVDGRDAVLYHHGYTNYRAVMTAAMKHLPDPEQILVMGGSAGGFGTALLSDDVIKLFPNCKDITCLVDSALLLCDKWPEVARDMWQAPKEIYENLHGTNITFDALKALHEKYGDSIRYLFASSVRDCALAQYQSYLDGKGLVNTKAGGERYQLILKDMYSQLKDAIPNIGLFIFDKPATGALKDMDLTIHCIPFAKAHKPLVGAVSPMSWLWNAVSGRVESFGLELLEK